MPVYMQSTIADLPRAYINGGRRGYLIGLTPSDVVRVLKPVLVDIATAPSA
jgi:prolyl-tRNA editing enzyme YbaK/EbsC (Cys-tRNA(Pro) deacylase)